MGICGLGVGLCDGAVFGFGSSGTSFSNESRFDFLGSAAGFGRGGGIWG
jgi:hypothetical protein